jgi:uncharacterized protein (DUF2147 family)
LKRFAVCLALLASIATAEPIATTLPGVYWLPEKDGQMQVYQKDNKYFGRVISYDVAGQLDEKNPNPEFRSRPIVGVDLLSEFSYDKESKRWLGGTIYDAKSGKTYKCRLWFEDDEPGVLWARGYIGISLLGRTERFERVKE